jgi:uncharacterized metal-binding protein YceD (DUF177 family)
MTEPLRVPVEFSRPVAADGVGPQPQVRRISAEPEERRQLAERFGLSALDSLSADLELSRHAGDIIGLSGRLEADVVQSCVVTLVPVPAHIETEFEVSYSTTAAEAMEVDLDPMAEEGPEPLIDGEIDLGEAVAQQLAVALDPYPRAPGAAWPQADTGDADIAAEPVRRPFAALDALKKRGKRP